MRNQYFSSILVVPLMVTIEIIRVCVQLYVVWTLSWVYTTCVVEIKILVLEIKDIVGYE